MHKRFPRMIMAAVFSLLYCGLATTQAGIPYDAILRMVATADTNSDGCLSFAETQATLPFVTSSLFRSIDADGDGLVCLTDVFVSGAVTPEQAYRLLVDFADANGDMAVSYAELTSVLPGVSAGQFNAIDTNQDGRLSLADVAPVTITVEPPPILPPILPPGGTPIIPPGEWTAYLFLVDTNRNGGISLAELMAFAPGITQDIFDALDKNGNGEVTVAEIQSLTVDDAIPAVIRIIKTFDFDRDLKISLGEAMSFSPLINADLFSSIDQNGDGMLDLNDLGLSIPEAYVSLLNAVLQTFLDSDANSDGCLTLDELRGLIPGATPEIFRLLDKNRDGAVCFRDLERLTMNDALPLAELILKAADRDRNLKITLEEAVAFCPFITADLFAEADQNGDSMLDLSDLDGSLPAGTTGALNDLLEAFMNSDANSDGCLSFTESQGLIAGMSLSLFTLLDKNADGAICLNDVQRLSAHDIFPAVEAVLEAADKDGDRALSFDEAHAFLPALNEAAFKYLDQNGDGVLSVEDIGNIAFVDPPPDVVVGGDPLQQFIVLMLSADSDGNGCLSLAEARTILPLLTENLYALLDGSRDGALCMNDVQSLGWDDVPALLNALLEIVDGNGDGRISFDESRAFLPALTREMFIYLDANGNGHIEYGDFSYVPILDPSTGTLDETLRRLLNLADTNNDGAISFDEAKALIPNLKRETFNMLDRNGDGVLTEADAAPLPPPSIDPMDALTRLLATADSNGDGVISYEEAAALIPGLPRSLFNSFDVNGDGVLSVGDLMNTGNDWGGILSKLLAIADTNGDGVVSFEEALKFMPGITQAMFSALDLNRDGVLSPADIPDVTILPVDPPVILPPDPLELLRQLLRTADANGDGGISLEEVQALIPGFLADLFHALDKNGDGVLSEADLPAPTLDPLELLRMLILRADTDANRSISLEEARAIVPDLQEALFNELDRNGDGSLSEADLPQAPPNGQIELLQRLLAAADTNGDGAISMDEARAIVPDLPASLFNALDANGDGVLSAADLGAPPPPVDPAELLTRLLGMADANRDGKVTLEEAQALMPQLTAEVFAGLDRNGDGSLSRDDLPSPGFDAAALINRLLALADRNGDGKVSLAEARTIIPDLPENLFRLLDVNGDGFLSVADLPNQPIDPLALLRQLLNTADANQDGKVTLEEARAIVPGLPADLFRAADRNKDGFLSVADLPNDWEVPSIENPLQLLQWLIRAADANGDGVITLEEAQAILPALSLDLFAGLDRNGDGALSTADLPPPPPQDPAARILALLKEVDANQDGLLTLEEIQAKYPEFTPQAFAALDANKDGVLSMADLPSAPPAGMREVLLRILREADTDNDGAVSLEEFLAARPDATVDAFTQLDLNGDGLLSRADLAEGEVDIQQGVHGLLEAADADGDGVATFEEVQAVRPNITPAQFDMLDTNGDGVLSVADLTVGAQDPEARLRALLGIADANRDGVVTFAELLAVAPDLTQDLFDKLDTNGDGVLTPDDSANATVDDPRSRIAALFGQADANGDGAVTFAELQAVMPNLSEAEFAMLDRNGDGWLTLDDLAELTPVPVENDLRHALLRALIRADRNQDGKLDAMEIARVFPDAPTDLLATIDTNHDWAIDKAELMAALGRNAAGSPIVAPEDADGDGQMTAADVQICINHAIGAGSMVLPPDVDGNGQVDAVDIQRIILCVLRGL
ncbi:MAG TPA: EF-hand domain-containing protein [Candidatus Hydrogenedentes bacterium]|nr:EF-hand domain-containing protein [Candidatus Hydrogenedentota bacterium]